MRWWQLILFALGTLRRSPLRMFLTACGVSIATGAMVSMLGYGLGVRAQLEVSVDKLGLLQRIEVEPRTRRESGGERRGEDERPPVPLDDEALARLAAIPGVAAAYPLVRISDVVAVRGERSQSAVALGLPPEAVALLEGLLVAGRPFSSGGEPEAILAKKLARDLGLEPLEGAPGKTVEIRAAGLIPRGGRAFGFEDRRVEVKVAGVFEPPPFAFGWGGDVILLPAELARGMPGSELESALHQLRGGADPSVAGYPQVVVRAARLADVDRIEREVRALGFETRTLAGQVGDLRKWLLLEQGMIFAVGTVALVVAGLGIINTLLMSVLERLREIGLYKALGASDGDVRVIFLAEAGLVGLGGGLGGLVLGLAVSRAIQAAFNRYASSLGIEGFLAVFSFPPWLLAGAVAFALIVSLASGVYPAHRAARLDPIRALRRE